MSTSQLNREAVFSSKLFSILDWHEIAPAQLGSIPRINIHQFNSPKRSDHDTTVAFRLDADVSDMLSRTTAYLLEKHGIEPCSSTAIGFGIDILLLYCCAIGWSQDVASESRGGVEKSGAGADMFQ
jgi:hypothetical protein